MVLGYIMDRVMVWGYSMYVAKLVGVRCVHDYLFVGVQFVHCYGLRLRYVHYCLLGYGMYKVMFVVVRYVHSYVCCSSVCT